MFQIQTAETWSASLSNLERSSGFHNASYAASPPAFFSQVRCRSGFHLVVVPDPSGAQHGETGADPSEQGDQGQTEQVQRSAEREQSSAPENRVARIVPADGISQPELFGEGEQVGIGCENMVVDVLQPAAVEVEGGQHAAGVRVLLEHRDGIPCAEQPVGGCEAGDAGADDAGQISCRFRDPLRP